MLEKMMDQQFMLYVLAGVSAVALLQKIIVSLLYRHLKKETDALPTVNDRWMKQLKLKFENTYKVSNQMTDVGVFVDRQVAKVKFFKAGLHGLNTFYRKAQLVCLLLGGSSYVVAAQAGRTTGDCNVFFVMGILAAIFIQLLDNLSGNVRSAELVKLNITDYFENILLPKLGQEQGTGTGYTSEYRSSCQPIESVPETDASGETDISSLKKDVRHRQREEIAAADIQKRLSRISGNKLSRDEEDRIVRDVLKEFLT